MIWLEEEFKDQAIFGHAELFRHSRGLSYLRVELRIAWFCWGPNKEDTSFCPTQSVFAIRLLFDKFVPDRFMKPGHFWSLWKKLHVIGPCCWHVQLHFIHVFRKVREQKLFYLTLCSVCARPNVDTFVRVRTKKIKLNLASLIKVNPYISRFYLNVRPLSLNFLHRLIDQFLCSIAEFVGRTLALFEKEPKTKLVLANSTKFVW